MQYLNVSVVSPYETLFSDKATSVSSKNSEGPFDILPQHVNFVTIIENDPIIVRTADKKEVKFSFPIAIIYNSSDMVKIYAQLKLPKL